MFRLKLIVLSAALLAGCGGDAPDARSEPASDAPRAPSKPSKPAAINVEACELLTAEEIEAAAGWKPDSSAAESYGTTRTCTFQGPQPLTQTLVLIVSRPAPKLESSTEMAEWRNRQAPRQPDLKMDITPVEGLGFPAVRSELPGSGNPTLEAAVGGMVLGVATADFEVAKALAPKAAARLRP
jgi:Protein of unknown function (DUF3558)